MATLVLQAAGSAVGGAVAGPVGTALGRVLGGVAGSAIDGSLLGRDEARVSEGPRVSDVAGLTSTEGAPIPRVYGRARLGGQLIWATRPEEAATRGVERQGSRGGKSLGSQAKTQTVTYSYFANLAIGLCEGPIAYIRRVWADGRELDLTTLTWRLHLGAEDQAPDPLILAKEGAGSAPAYRGLAYIVFERLALADFGNRVPQFSFEVVRPVGELCRQIRAVCLIPGATEFGYELLPVTQELGLGRSQPENRHQFQSFSDVALSISTLQALCPNLKRVALVVSWFGDDLRAGHCTVAPRVDRQLKATHPLPWSVAGLDRLQARPVTLVGGVPAYGGTPSDASVVRLVQFLKSRGLEVVLYPFVMMDVAQGNLLPDPRGGASQPPYPWRGRITCDPAPGRPGSPDGAAAAGSQVAAFFGTAAAGDFSTLSGSVAYSGPEEWSYRRLVLHCAGLALLAGGVHGFVLGSELVGLTRVRSGEAAYPAVAELAGLAGDLRGMLGSATKLVYAADWTEYGAHVREGGASVTFPLDPLFAHPAIDAVGIDYYPPISDWRDGASHLDRAEGRSAQDEAYLQARLTSGEAFDWHYATPADRAAQVRAPITDGAFGRPWVYRAKDLVSWWSEPHVERLNGVETGPTPWVPRSKPIWLTEIGVPAVDKGANGPNVFPDPKSSESSLPPFSSGARDDLVQARALSAILTRFDDALGRQPAGANPSSPSYGGPMVDPASIFVWAWDARPWPAFPDLGTVWADGVNWETGHWITGRLEGAPLDRIVAAVLADLGHEGGVEPLDGFLDGYVIDRPMAAREALEPLARLFGFDALARAGTLAVQGRAGREVLDIAPDDLAEDGKAPLLALVRAQESELPAQVEVGFTDGEGEYRRAAVAARRLGAGGRREARVDVAAVTRRRDAQRLAEAWLQDVWAGRETAELALGPRHLGVEPGDLLRLPTEGGPRLHRVQRIVDGAVRKVATRAVEPAVYRAPGGAPTRTPRRQPPVPGRPFPVVLDLAAARGEPAPLQWLAVAADPWPGAVAVWRSGDGASFSLHRIVELPAILGRTLDPLGPGPLWRWDRRGAFEVELSSGHLTSVPDEAALAGANLFALQGTDGAWEILSAARAEMTGERRYRLSRLLRGQAGTEAQAARQIPEGALLVRLDDAVIPLTDGLADLGRPWTYRVAPVDRDHADPLAAGFSATAGPLALRPLSPVRVAARRTGEGVRIAWIRRARRDGDSWETVEIPLSEESEAYAVEVLAAGAVKRSFACAAPELLYPAADELADFGAPQASLTVRVAQMSAAVGRGEALEATVRVG